MSEAEAPKPFTIADIASSYVRVFGMHLLPLHAGTKRPIGKDWQQRAVSDPAEAHRYWTQNPQNGIGLHIGPSGFCALDIDQLELFEQLLEDYGVDPRELDQFPTVVGNPKGKRIIWRAPKELHLQCHKLEWPNEADPTGEKHRDILRRARDAKKAGDEATAEALKEEAKQYARIALFELHGDTRGDSARNNVLPPSIHPDTGKPYTWTVKPPRKLSDWPTPPDWLLIFWQEWTTSFERQFQRACPWYVPSAEELQPRTYATPVKKDDVSVIDYHNERTSIAEALAQYGYTKTGKTEWLSPHSSTGNAGVHKVPGENKVWIHHASDPLGDGGRKPVNPFDLYLEYEHRGNMKAAIKALAKQYDLNKKPERPLAPAPQEIARTEELPQERREVVQQYKDARRQWPFRALGYNGGTYYYLPDGTEQVCGISAAGHTTPGSMMQLASINWWVRQFPKDPDNDAKGIDWMAAASACMEWCKELGVYLEEDVRGRGAWYDDGRSVVHAGDRLLVDGVPVRIKDFQTGYIYEKGGTLDRYIDTPPAAALDAQKVLRAFQLMNWKNNTHASFAAGWVVLAPICGALDWRPHLWITGEKGSGKTWVINRVIKPLLGDTFINTLGKTSEAGIRQFGNQDARPVIIDESESEDKRSRDSLQNIIELARMSSSESGASIIKGTSGGKAISFKVRSTFLMNSINVMLNMAADESRFAVSKLLKNPKTRESEARWEELKEIERKYFQDPYYCASVRSRIYRLIPVIRANASTLASVIRGRTGSQRMGDQYGALIAGVIALSSESIITEEQASIYVDAIDLSDAEDADDVSDEETLLEEILQYQIRYDSDSGHQLTRTIREIMQSSIGILSADTGLHRKSAKALLERYGILVHTNGFVSIANRHKGLREILRGTPWESGHKVVLERLPGAYQVKNPIKMGDEQKTSERVVRVPIECFRLDVKSNEE